MYRDVEVDAYVRRIQELVERALSLTSGLAPEVRQLVAGIDDPLRLCYLLGDHARLEGRREAAAAREPIRSLKKLELVHSLLTREVVGARAQGQDRIAGAAGDDRRAAPVLPAPAAEGDSAGAGRGRRQRRQGSAHAHRRREAARRTSRPSPIASSIGWRGWARPHPSRR